VRRRGTDGGMVEMGVWGGNGCELGREVASGMPCSQISKREGERESERGSGFCEGL
jgi:hypothetical protein